MMKAVRLCSRCKSKPVAKFMGQDLMRCQRCIDTAHKNRTPDNCIDCEKRSRENGFTRCAECQAKRSVRDRRYQNKLIMKNRLFGRSHTRGVELFQKITGFQIPKHWLDAR
jgi:hypothetical protein